MKRFHLAVGVSDVEASADDYSQRLGCRPDLLIPVS
jgi:extradiol dioxygenase family protein